eukprot:6746267-Prymnesium_polylepis.1
MMKRWPRRTWARMRPRRSRMPGLLKMCNRMSRGVKRPMQPSAAMAAIELWVLCRTVPGSGDARGATACCNVS